jgi:hypothetical protein
VELSSRFLWTLQLKHYRTLRPSSRRRPLFNIRSTTDFGQRQTLGSQSSHHSFSLASSFRCACRLWFVAGAIVMAIVLYAQASSELRSADLILANAAYLELVTFPSVSSLAELLSNLDPQPKSQGEWMGAIVGGLALLGLFEESDHALKDLRCDAVAQRHDAAHPEK